MGYNNKCLTIRDRALDGGIATFTYQTDETRAQIDATGYFADGADFGMKAGDVVFVQRRNSDTVDIHRAIAVSGRAVSTRFFKGADSDVIGQSDAIRIGMSLVQPLSISQVDYDALAVKDPNTLYLIPEA